MMKGGKVRGERKRDATDKAEYDGKGNKGVGGRCYRERDVFVRETLLIEPRRKKKIREK